MKRCVWCLTPFRPVRSDQRFCRPRCCQASWRERHPQLPRPRKVRLGLSRYQQTGSTSPALDDWLLRRMAAGWTPEAIVAASGGILHMPTVQRWARAFLGLQEVRVGEHRATFVIRRGAPPIRVSVWQ